MHRRNYAALIAQAEKFVEMEWEWGGPPISGLMNLKEWGGGSHIHVLLI